MIKGVSSIIATILLLIITISLVGTAYLFMSGMLTGRISKPISIMTPPSCNASYHITLVVSNDGTDFIKEKELKIYIDSEPKGWFNKSIEPKNINVTSDIQGNSGSNHVMVVSPSNQDESTAWC